MLNFKTLILKKNYYLRNLLIIGISSILLTLSAKISIYLPFSPVPFTLQTFVIFTIALSLHPKLAIGSILFYIFQGIIGIPVFAGPYGGISYMLGPTGGYIIGFVIAVSFVSVFKTYLKNITNLNNNLYFILIFIIILIGECLLFATGIIWLSFYTGFKKAIYAGLIPFIPAELFKIALLFTILPFLNKLTDKFNHLL